MNHLRFNIISKGLLNLVILFFFAGLNSIEAQEKRTEFIIHTSMGDMKGELFNETPMHRDNFIKLAKEGWFEDSFFHRVINNFMIQGGHNADGREDAGYTVPAEFVPEIYVHHKGMLAAARERDKVNPTKASSAAQFYIVQGKILSLGQVKSIEEKINTERKQLAIKNYIIFPSNEKWFFKMDALMKAKDMEGVKLMENNIYNEMIERGEAPTEFHYTEKQIEIYTTIGGTPHLDGSYSVYGRITDGWEVLDKIAATPVLGSSPIEKVLMKIEILD
ncbi:MAG: peptidylprolyl isomerase [Bacteroidales bacterium]|jgi:peptidylprolyl isomerase|nr:peptidylprolyl isomerase [Bacteroidales bacterium]